MMQSLNVHINGQAMTSSVEDDLLLVSYLREQCRLTGTHIGCDTSQCGACVVMVDDVAVKSCTMLAIQADNTKVVTIEGIAPDQDTLHPMQKAFRTAHGLQCGYCTPGMIISAIDYVNSGGALDEDSIRKGREGNICRCTGYHNIIRSVQLGAKMMGDHKGDL